MHRSAAEEALGRHDQTQDASQSRPIRYCAVLQSRVIQELDFASGSLIIDNDRILPNRRCLSVLADVAHKISKNVDPRMGKGTSEFGHRVAPKDGTRSEKTINSRNDFALVFQVADIYRVDLGALI